MSAIGQTESFTHLLIRARSFQILGVSTTSRASSGLVSHSPAYSAQKPIHPTEADPPDRRARQAPDRDVKALVAPRLRGRGGDDERCGRTGGRQASSPGSGVDLGKRDREHEPDKR
jgi:hypothetical protein